MCFVFALCQNFWGSNPPKFCPVVWLETMIGIKSDEIASKLHFKKYDKFQFDKMTACDHLSCVATYIHHAV